MLSGAVLGGGLTSVLGAVGYLSEPRAAGPVPTLDGLAFLEAQRPSEREAYRWLNSAVPGNPVVLEAHGPPYQAFSRVAMNTGLPTVLGWEYHLWQQGRHREEIDARARAVREMYDTTDAVEAERLLRHYRVDLVVVGPLERQTYSAAGLAKFEVSSDFQPAFRSGDMVVYERLARAATVKTWVEPIPYLAPRAAPDEPRRQPRGIARAADGTLAIADFGNRRVQRLDPDLRPFASFGREGSAPGDFRDPCGIALDDDGHVWVADTWNHRVQHFDQRGRFLEQWHASLYGPRGIAVRRDGWVFVTDTGNRRVVGFSPTGVSRVVAEGDTVGEPVGIAVGDNGEIFVADVQFGRISVFDDEGRLLRHWPVAGWRPGIHVEPYVSIGPDRVVWATDPAAGRVLLFNEGGRMLGVATAERPLSRPLGVAAIAEGRAVVTDAATGNVVEVRRP